MNEDSHPGAVGAVAALRRLDGRVAVVTGAGGDIGRAICVRLASEGATLIATDRTHDQASAAADAVESAGGHARPLAADVTRAEDLEKIVPFAVEQFGEAPSIAVCCAGIETFSDIFEMSTEEWDRVFDVNARGTFLTIRAVAPAMREAHHGSIVTIASIQGRLGSRYFANYSASKAAILSVTKSFAVTLAGDGVRVNAVAPGIVDTALWRAADTELARLRGLAPGEPRRQRVEQVPLKRAGTSEDVAAAVAFLASEDSSYITGECIHVCGGDLMI